jgi:hypothetical protein
MRLNTLVMRDMIWWEWQPGLARRTGSGLKWRQLANVSHAQGSIPIDNTDSRGYETPTNTDVLRRIMDAILAA